MILEPINPALAEAIGLTCRERDYREFSAVTGLYDREKLARWMGDRYGSIHGLLAASSDDGVPTCVGGAVHIRPGTCALLFYATDCFDEIGLPMTRFIKRRYFPQLEAQGYHRIECVTSAAYPEMHRWLDVLGMQREGVLRSYGAGGEDFIQYARVSDARSTRY